MDTQTQALVDAAFHAWLSLGEWLVKHPGPSAQHDDFLACYQALEAALAAFPPVRRAPAAPE